MYSKAVGILLILTGDFVSGSDHFCYIDKSCDPDSEAWPEICHKGHKQSPIDLPYDVTTIEAAKNNPKPLLFNDGYVFDSFYIQNNGHSIQISFSPSLNSSAQMSGYGFTHPYILAQIHFHWGNDLKSGGSEHTLNGKQLPMELHFVHYNSMYASFAEAAGAKDDDRSLAVLGIFLDPVEDKDRSDLNEDFDKVTANIPLKFNGTSVKVNGELDLRPFLPQPPKMFFRYMGSLTTPDCNEDVEWTVVAEPVKVPKSLYDKLQDVDDLDNHRVGMNFRHVMPLDGRTIEIYTSSGISIHSLRLFLIPLAVGVILGSSVMLIFGRFNFI